MTNSNVKIRAPRNRTLTLSAAERAEYTAALFTPDGPLTAEQMRGKILHGDARTLLRCIPDKSVKLLILDPPYNLDKTFNRTAFSACSDADYCAYLEQFFPEYMRIMSDDASLYCCGDFRSSPLIYLVLKKFMIVRNRIVWQREKGRASQSNWKNSTEDIWFATVGKKYTFNPEAVKLKRRVIAPYRDSGGAPKDWVDAAEGKFRLTGAGNFWDDISIPYWSMPENTDHPTQKPEKLMAKLILASSNVGDMVFDPFSGSGTTAVTAKKLQREFCGIELDAEYCCWALARLKRAERNPEIQGYEDGIFYERNAMKSSRKA